MLRCNELYGYGSYFGGGAPLAFTAVSPFARERAESCESGTLGCTTEIVDGEAWRTLSICNQECAAELESVEWWLTRPPVVPLRVSVELRNNKDSLDTVTLLEEFSVRLERRGMHFVFFLMLGEINTLEPFGTLLSRAEEVDLDLCSDLTSLGGFDGLRFLKRVNFHYCGITDVTAMRSCALLEAVSFISCPLLTSLHALQGLQRLKRVDVSDCPITSLDPLRTCHSLESVGFDSCRSLMSLDGLQGLQHLKIVYVSGCPVTSLDALCAHPSLGRVLCLSTHATSLQPVEGLSYVKLASVSVDNVGDIDLLHTCRALETVKIAGAVDMISLDGLRTLPRLRELVIVSCGITSLDALHTFEALEELHITSCNSLTSLEHFKGPPNLKDITISDCPITSIRSLNTCVSLQRVNVSSCPLLHSLEGLGGLPNLEWVCARGSGIIDISAIAQCPVLRYVDVRDCPKLQSVDVLLERGDMHVEHDQ
ncbi:BspA type Leucine rich repeat region (6 copies), putative [Angomonas deanei]|uniref:BspA type Leucine rich repeat region (6 copies), putative n=1 Tax=Angomonas deanei TaxID=59799 RepID=A0A7G2CX67_9TRYP|nr:BspA type Leucine rich repeat region (6 copies), putative [Angomonas deanei]